MFHSAVACDQSSERCWLHLVRRGATGNAVLPPHRANVLGGRQRPRPSACDPRRSRGLGLLPQPLTLADTSLGIGAVGSRGGRCPTPVGAGQPCRAIVRVQVARSSRSGLLPCGSVPRRMSRRSEQAKQYRIERLNGRAQKLRSLLDQIDRYGLDVDSRRTDRRRTERRRRQFDRLVTKIERLKVELEIEKQQLGER